MTVFEFEFEFEFELVEEDCKRMIFSTNVTRMCRNCVPLLT